MDDEKHTRTVIWEERQLVDRWIGRCNTKKILVNVAEGFRGELIKGITRLIEQETQTLAVENKKLNARIQTYEKFVPLKMLKKIEDRKNGKT